MREFQRCLNTLPGAESDKVQNIYDDGCWRHGSYHTMYDECAKCGALPSSGTTKLLVEFKMLMEGGAGGGAHGTGARGKWECNRCQIAAAAVLQRPHFSL
jgi:hypothetical protein